MEISMRFLTEDERNQLQRRVHELEEEFLTPEPMSESIKRAAVRLGFLSEDCLSPERDPVEVTMGLAEMVKMKALLKFDEERKKKKWGDSW